MVYLELRSVSELRYFLLRGGPCRSASSRLRCSTPSSLATVTQPAGGRAVLLAAADGLRRQGAASTLAWQLYTKAVARAAPVSSQAPAAEAAGHVQTAGARHAAAACQSAAVEEAAAAAMPKAARAAQAARDPTVTVEKPPKSTRQLETRTAGKAAAAAELSQLPSVVEESVVHRAESCLHPVLQGSVGRPPQQASYEQQVRLQKALQQPCAEATHQQHQKPEQQTQEDQQAVLQMRDIAHREAGSVRDCRSNGRASGYSNSPKGRQEISGTAGAVAGAAGSEQDCSAGPFRTTCCNRSAETVRKGARSTSSIGSKTARSSTADSGSLGLSTESSSSSRGAGGLMAGSQGLGVPPLGHTGREEEVTSELSTAAELLPLGLPGGCVAGGAVKSSCGHCGRSGCRAEHGGAPCAGGPDAAATAASSPGGAAAAADSLVAGAAALPSSAAAADALGDNTRGAASGIPSLLVIAGPSGVGKGTLAKRILSYWPNAIRFSVSHTTRAPRPGEQQGREYYFCTAEEFEAMKKAGGFLESATFSGFSYGTSIAAVRSIQSQGCVCLLEIDLEGIRQVQESKLANQARFVFIQPPSLSELERRLRGRRTETEEHIHSRLEAAQREMSMSEKLHFDARITNADLEEAWDRLRQAVVSWFGPRLRQERRANTATHQPVSEQQQQAQ